MIPKAPLLQALLATSLCLTPTLYAQFTTPQAPTGPLHNLATLKPPPGAKVALVVFEDLGCPHCAAAHPVELQVSTQDHIPIVRYDTPIRAHVWTFQGAVNARYIQEKISPQLAEAYRTDLFKSQMSIASLDDLQHFTQAWLQHHNKPLPNPIDPDGSLLKQVTADRDLAKNLGVAWTPTILVITQNKQQVVMGADPTEGEPQDIAPVVQAALAQVTPPKTSGKTHGK